MRQPDRPIRRDRSVMERARSREDDFGRGIVAYREGRYADAVHLLERAADADADSEARCFLGLAQMAAHDYEAAASSFSTAIEQGHRTPDVVEGLADALFYLERYEEAVEAYRVALVRRASARAYARLGQALVRLGQRAEAEDAFKKALQLKLRNVASLRDFPEETELPDDVE